MPSSFSSKVTHYIRPFILNRLFLFSLEAAYNPNPNVPNDNASSEMPELFLRGVSFCEVDMKKDLQNFPCI